MSGTMPASLRASLDTGDEDSRMALNLKVMRRQHSTIERIVETFSHATLYKLDETQGKWVRTASGRLAFRLLRRSFDRKDPWAAALFSFSRALRLRILASFC